MQFLHSGPKLNLLWKNKWCVIIKINNQNQNLDRFSPPEIILSCVLWIVFHFHIRFHYFDADVIKFCDWVDIKNNDVLLYRSRHPEDLIVTPFAQILHSLRNVHNNYIIVTNVLSSRYVVVVAARVATEFVLSLALCWLVSFARLLYACRSCSMQLV